MVLRMVKPTTVHPEVTQQRQQRRRRWIAVAVAAEAGPVEEGATPAASTGSSQLVPKGSGQANLLEFHHRRRTRM